MLLEICRDGNGTCWELVANILGDVLTLLQLLIFGKYQFSISEERLHEPVGMNTSDSLPVTKRSSKEMHCAFWHCYLVSPLEAENV